MRAKILLLPIAALLALTTACAFGEAPLNPLTAESKYPGLFSSALKLAIPGPISEGELLVGFYSKDDILAKLSEIGVAN